MSAIHGVLRFDGRSVRNEDLARQARAMAHRGPDRQAAWCDGALGMGHLLLRVTREDSFDAQPLHAADGSCVLVADLRLDNRDDLALELSIENALLPELPDSEILLRAYQHWGDDCLDHLVGDFAFALWDERNRSLLLARDHMGQRHLHYHVGKDSFSFATEVKGLWAAADVPQKLDLPVFARRLARDRTPTHGATSFEGVFGLEGGTLMRVTAAGEVSVRRYWTPHADPRHLARDEDYYIRAYREVLGEAVACRVRRARQNPALMLGGGFDSGAIAGLAGPALSGQNKTLVCVASVEVGDGLARGVRKWTQILARDMPHLDLRYVTRDGLDVFANMEKSFLAIGEPHSPNHYTVRALFTAAAGAGARVIMDGYGGDYTLNPRGTGWLARRLRLGQFGRFLSEYAAYRRHTGASLAKSVRSEVGAQLLPAGLVRSWRKLRNGVGMFGPAAPITPAMLQVARSKSGNLDTRAATISGDLVWLMARMLKRLQSGHVAGYSLHAATHGLEFTQPYHDKRVVELALAIPETLHVRNGRDRHVARNALADLYPPEFQRRGSTNDELIPDFYAMAEGIKPRLLSEITRMEKDTRLSSLFDFPRMRRMLGAERPRPLTKRDEAAARNAVHAFLHARFMEWFQRDNRPNS